MLALFGLLQNFSEALEGKMEEEGGLRSKTSTPCGSGGVSRKAPSRQTSLFPVP